MTQNHLDGTAFMALYRAQAESVLRYFARRVLDPRAAADLTAETFAEAYASRGSFRAGKGTPDEWLFGVARKRLARYFESPRLERSARDRLGLAAAEVSDEDYDRIEAMIDFAEVSRACAKLSRHWRPTSAKRWYRRRRTLLCADRSTAIVHRAGRAGTREPWITNSGAELARDSRRSRMSDIEYLNSLERDFERLVAAGDTSPQRSNRLPRLVPRSPFARAASVVAVAAVVAVAIGFLSFVAGLRRGHQRVGGADPHTGCELGDTSRRWRDPRRHVPSLDGHGRREGPGPDCEPVLDLEHGVPPVGFESESALEQARELRRVFRERQVVEREPQAQDPEHLRDDQVLPFGIDGPNGYETRGYSYQQMLKFPKTADALLRMAGAAHAPPVMQYQSLAWFATQVALPADTRAAVFKALAQMPGIKRTDATTVDGQHLVGDRLLPRQEPKKPRCSRVSAQPEHRLHRTGARILERTCRSTGRRQDQDQRPARLHGDDQRADGLGLDQLIAVKKIYCCSRSLGRGSRANSRHSIPSVSATRRTPAAIRTNIEPSKASKPNPITRVAVAHTSTESSRRPSRIREEDKIRTDGSDCLYGLRSAAVSQRRCAGPDSGRRAVDHPPGRRLRRHVRHRDGGEPLSGRGIVLESRAWDSSTSSRTFPRTPT